MTFSVAFLALMLHRDVYLVQKVSDSMPYDPLLAVALVESESQFKATAFRKEPRGHTSWGLWQLDDEWHPQHRGNLDKHIAEGAAVFSMFLLKAKGDRRLAVAMWNGGGRPPAKSYAFADRVMALYNDLRSTFMVWR